MQQNKTTNVNDFASGQCIHQLFESAVLIHPDKIAVVFANNQLSYDQLNRKANRLAHCLLHQGLTPESLVGIYVSRSLSSIICQLAVLKAGGAYVPLDLALPQERLDYIATDANLALVLIDPDNSSSSGFNGCRQLVCDYAQSDEFSDYEHNPNVSIGLDHLVHIIYTSGSTGEPKGVARLHRSVVNHIHWLMNDFPFVNEKQIGHLTSFNFVRSVWELFTPLISGVTVNLLGSDQVKDLPALLALIEQQQLSRIATSPSLVSALMTYPKERLEALKAIRCWYVSGEKLPMALVEKIEKRYPDLTICNIYGSTEVGPVASMTMKKASEECLKLNTVPIGFAGNQVTLLLLNDDLQPVAEGELGEICVSGVNIPRGYLNKPDLTARQLVPDSFSGVPGQLIYRTGDSGIALSDGNIRYVGRLDHQVKLRGFRIELGEVEEVLKNHEDVRESAVVVKSDHLDVKSLVAYVVMSSSDSIFDPHVLRVYLQRILPEYMIPSMFVQLPQMPLTFNGKLDRKALPAPDISAQLNAHYVAPRNEDEVKMEKIWREVLELDRIGVEDDFFEIGGHSLLATQVVSRIQDVFDVSIAVRRVFQFPQITSLTEHVQSALWLLAHNKQLPPCGGDEHELGEL